MPTLYMELRYKHKIQKKHAFVGAVLKYLLPDLQGTVEFPNGTFCMKTKPTQLVIPLQRLMWMLSLHVGAM